MQKKNQQVLAAYSLIYTGLFRITKTLKGLAGQSTKELTLWKLTILQELFFTSNIYTTEIQTRLFEAKKKLLALKTFMKVTERNNKKQTLMDRLQKKYYQHFLLRNSKLRNLKMHNHLLIFSHNYP
jgi:hypothetical protein